MGTLYVNVDVKIPIKKLKSTVISARFAFMAKSSFYPAAVFLFTNMLERKKGTDTERFRKSTSCFQIKKSSTTYHCNLLDSQLLAKYIDTA